MEKSERNLERSVLDLMNVENVHEFQDPALGEVSQIIYNHEHEFMIRIQ